MRNSVFVLAGLLTAAAAFAQSPCERLKSAAPADATFTAVELVPAGPYTPPSNGNRASQPIPLPAHCRVAATLKPSDDSDIKMEIWLPVENWNGKFQMVGNGGWAGIISYPAMAAALKEGYATSSTDTGHEGANGMFALGHPQKIVDFGYRAVHETVVKSKLLINSFYGKQPQYSYWNGCSTGGRQALVEVTKFPNDFDGVIAGAPANPHIHLHSAGVERSVELIKNNAALSPAKIETLHKAILATCDAKDGVKDGLIDDPRKCNFDPSSLLCKGAETDNCLTAGQVETVKITFADVKTKKGETIWTGFTPGSELQLASLRTVPTAPGGGWDSIRILGHQDADYDWRKFDLDSDVVLADKSGIDAHTYDLTPFKAHGGKLLLYHGWADQLIPPGNTINFYEGVVSKMGKDQADWMRLFMVPGMQHCQGGAGPDQFNKMAVIERWTEAKTPPQTIIASHVAGSQVDMTRPLCPYPQEAVYNGVGSTNDAASFSCKVR